MLRVTLPKKRPRKQFKKIVVPLIAAVFIVAGVWGYWDKYKTTHNPIPEIPSAVITNSTSRPDETPLSDVCENYEVADQDPRKIEIESANISGCIHKVGVDQHNNIAVPVNIHLAGWYVESVLPGEKGVSIIDGHVLGRYNDAIFTNLDQVKTGELVKIQFGDESWKEFEIVEIENYSVEEATEELFKTVEDAESQLTLITCGGDYDKDAQTYKERVFVRARLV